MLLCSVFWRIPSTLSFCVLGLFPLCNILFSFYGYKYFPSVFEYTFLGFVLFFVLLLFSLLSHLLFDPFLARWFSFIHMWGGGNKKAGNRVWRGWLTVRCLFWYNRQESGHSALEFQMPTCGVLSHCIHPSCMFIQMFFCCFVFVFVFRGRAHVSIIAVVFPVVVFIEVNTWL